MGRARQHVTHQTTFDHAAAVHDGDVISHLCDDAQVVGNEHHCHVTLALQVEQQVHDLRLHRMNYGSGGVGTTPHLSGELFATMARLKIVHIPYKGEGPAIIDVLAGHLPFMFSNVTASNAHVQAGKMRALAVTGLQRTPAVPGVATLAESGLPGFEVVGFFGVIAPAATPREIVTLLNAEIGRVLARPDVRERFAFQALEPGNKTAEQFGDYIQSEAGKWEKLIKEAGITAK